MREPSKKTPDLVRKILSDHEVRYMTRGLRNALSSMSAEFSGQYGSQIEDSVRFGAVAARLREARESRGMDLKAVARAVRVPQYRVRYIEECRVKNLRSSDLHAYVDFLELGRWFAVWRKANAKLAARLGADLRG